MDNIKVILEKLLAILMLVGKYIAIAIEVIGKIIAWLAGVVTGYASGVVKAVFGIKK